MQTGDSAGPVVRAALLGGVVGGSLVGSAAMVKLAGAVVRPHVAASLRSLPAFGIGAVAGAAALAGAALLIPADERSGRVGTATAGVTAIAAAGAVAGTGAALYHARRFTGMDRLVIAAQEFTGFSIPAIGLFGAAIVGLTFTGLLTSGSR